MYSYYSVLIRWQVYHQNRAQKILEETAFPVANVSKVSFKYQMRQADSALPVTLSSSNKPCNRPSLLLTGIWNSGLFCPERTSMVYTRAGEAFPPRIAMWGIGSPLNRLGNEAQSTEETGPDSAMLTLRWGTQA